MRVAIYQFMNLHSDCPSCSQASRKQLIINAVRCKEKIHEVFPDEEHEFKNYIDFNETVEDGIKKRVHLDDLFLDIKEGMIDLVIVTYLGAIDTDIQFVIDIYKELKRYGIKLMTVRDGLKVMDTLDQAILSQ